MAARPRSLAAFVFGTQHTLKKTSVKLRGNTMNQRALAAEFIGTFALVFVGCGTAMFSGPMATGGIVAVSFAFGLTIVTMAFALGHISGGHFNPAVTAGLVAGGRFSSTEAPYYIAAQVLGGLAAAAVLSSILGGAPVGAGATKWNDMQAVSNHFGGAKEFSMAAAFIIEFVMAALFLIVIMGSTSKRAPAGFAPIAIGLAVVLFHLLSIPVTNTSLNPARSTAPALFAGGAAVSQLWLFWVAPILGALVGGWIARWAQNEQ
jgi:aquaporin Z